MLSFKQGLLLRNGCAHPRCRELPEPVEYGLLSKELADGSREVRGQGLPRIRGPVEHCWPDGVERFVLAVHHAASALLTRIWVHALRIFKNLLRACNVYELSEAQLVP